MKIVFFSDIHGNKYVLDQLAKDLEKLRPGKIVFCGDIFGYYYYPFEVLDFLRMNNVECILGNHDKLLLDLCKGKLSETELVNKYGSTYANVSTEISREDYEFIKELSPQLEFCTDGLRFGVFHGSPEDPLNGRVYPDMFIFNRTLYNKYDFVVLGHTHHKMVKYIEKTTVINPGSIGQQRDGKGCSYLVFDTKVQEFWFNIIEYDVSKLLGDVDRYDCGNVRLKEVLVRRTMGFKR